MLRSATCKPHGKPNIPAVWFSGSHVGAAFLAFIFTAVAKDELMILATDRQCIECGQHIAGRTDKKFCNDQCRTAWHNRQNSGDDCYVRNVNSILRKNRRILAELTVDGSKEIRTITLTKLGFKFDYFTSARKGRNGFLERFCYDKCYMPVSNGVYLLKSK